MFIEVTRAEYQPISMEKAERYAAGLNWPPHYTKKLLFQRPCWACLDLLKWTCASASFCEADGVPEPFVYSLSATT
ncbi:hypothetical protein KCU83_g137, partial [Aureobasidium melanogenum]